MTSATRDYDAELASLLAVASQVEGQIVDLKCVNDDEVTVQPPELKWVSDSSFIVEVA